MKKIFKPTKGIVTLFLVLFLLMFYFVLPYFSSCRAGGVACRLDEPEVICEKRSIEFRRNCEVYINTLAVVFLIISYIISSQIVCAFGGTTIGKFVSYSFWKIILLTVLFIALSFLYYNESLVLDAYILERGWPLPYWIYSESTWEFKPSAGVSEFIYPNLVLDFIFWYLISSGIVFVWNRYRSKHHYHMEEESV